MTSVRSWSARCTPFYREYQFIPQRTSAEILAKFEGERQEFVRGMLRCAKKSAKWFHIDLVETAEKLGSTRERLVQALNHLESQGDLQLKVAGLRQAYQMKSRPGETEAAELRETLIERFRTREDNDIGRLHQVTALVEGGGCIVRRLLDYFGEDLGGDCGHCGYCEGEPAGPIPESAAAPSEQTIRRCLAEVSAMPAARALRSPRQRTRFLCGIASPGVSREKLGRHALFGSLSSAPFPEVLRLAREIA